MSGCSVLLENVTLLRGVEGKPSTPRSSLASFNTTNTVAFFNTTEQRGILQQNEAA
jgi:hypothetical protein